MKSAGAGPRIHTLTGNLLWEQTLDFADWGPGRTQRAAGASFQVGGKGINVSRMLRRLGAPNTALLVAGGFAGAACRSWLRSQGFPFRAFRASTPTRTGVVVRGGRLPETTFLGPDAAPGAGAVRACAAYLDSRPRGGVLALCGSFPGWKDPSFDPLRRSIESGDVEEERRLFYVAVTRARNELYLCYPKIASRPGPGGMMNTPSRFLQELSPDLYQQLKIKRITPW